MSFSSPEPYYAGPLTTLFTPPPQCYNGLVTSIDNVDILVMNLPIPTATVPNTVSALTSGTGTTPKSTPYIYYQAECFPSGFQGLERGWYWSPGICPSDYTTAASRTRDAGAKEMEATCCPSQYSYNGGDYYCLSTMVTPEVVQLITVTDGSASGLYTIITGPTAIVTPKTSGTSTGRAVMAAPFSVRWKSAEETLFPSRPPPQTSQTHNATSASSAPPAPTTAGTAPTAAGTATASSTAHRTLSNGAIAGVAIAAVVTVMLTTVALVYFLRRKRSGLGFAAAQIRPRKRKEEVPPASGSNSGGTRETTVANAPNYRSHGPLNLSALIPTELPAPGHVHSTSPALSSLDDHAPVSSPTSPQAPHSTPSQPSQSSSPLLATTTRTSAGRPLAEQLRELEAEEERLKELGRVAQRKREVLERLERGEE